MKVQGWNESLGQTRAKGKNGELWKSRQSQSEKRQSESFESEFEVKVREHRVERADYVKVIERAGAWREYEKPRESQEKKARGVKKEFRCMQSNWDRASWICNLQ